jgi:hypothetical protein
VVVVGGGGRWGRVVGGGITHRKALLADQSVFDLVVCLRQAAVLAQHEVLDVAFEVVL